MTRGARRTQILVMAKRRVHYDSSPHLQQLTAMLKEMMDQSPDPHLPEERDRISIELSDRALPHLSSVIRADDDQAVRTIALLVYWFEDAYDGLLKNYPRQGR